MNVEDFYASQGITKNGETITAASVTVSCEGCGQDRNLGTIRPMSSGLATVYSCDCGRPLLTLLSNSMDAHGNSFSLA